MGKGAVCIVFFSIIIIGLFILMCYLMSRVNPPPLEIEQIPTEKVGRMILYDHVLFDNEDIHEAPTTEKGNVSLYKTEQGSIEDLATFATVQVAFDLDYSTLYTFPTPRNYRGTAAPNTLINRTMPLPILKVFNKTEEIDRETTTAGKNGSEILLPVKRSVKEFKKVKGEINSLILKIIDDSGQFNIEIKIGSNVSYWNGNDKNRKMPKLSMYLKTKHDGVSEPSDLTKNNNNELNADSIHVSINDEFDRAFGNKSNYVKDIDQVHKNDNVTENTILEQHIGYKTSNKDTINYNITKSDDNITDHYTTKHNSINIDDMSNLTYTTLDYIKITENSTKIINDTIFQRGTNNITNNFNITFSQNNVTFACNVTGNKNDSIELNHVPSNTTTYNDTTTRIMQLEDSTKYNIVDNEKKSTRNTNSDLHKYFFDNETEFLRPLSKTVEFIDNALSINSTFKKSANTNTDGTTENMDIDILIPMESINPNTVDANDNIVTVIEKPVTTKSTIKPLELTAHYIKSTIPFKVSIKNNNSLQTRKAIQKGNDKILKINKSGKYKNLPIVIANSKEFALDSGSDQGLGVKDTR